MDAIQWCFHRVTYGKNYEEYLAFCEENNVNPRAPMAFSDTRFPQYCYYVLRNFLEVYVQIVQNLDAEHIVKDGIDESL